MPSHPRVDDESVPRFRPGVRLIFDEVRSCHALLFPEGVRLLNSTAGAIVVRCDGSTSVKDLAASLATEFDGVGVDDVCAFVAELVRARLVEVAG